MRRGRSNTRQYSKRAGWQRHGGCSTPDLAVIERGACVESRHAGMALHFAQHAAKETSLILQVPRLPRPYHLRGALGGRASRTSGTAA
ncbi:hypothetical protein B0T16DRAFT_396830 [Cercophora newfieldiana]|uniref:Uncharacterized protein n=1 Tax=Cercophora newfieldiana TaxID=92897 RepID=A0AA39YMX2_9PEZI|nr:hypothetical protein B0T16DRAFT_396830 [Cercophora newfieldiana]